MTDPLHLRLANGWTVTTVWPNRLGFWWPHPIWRQQPWYRMAPLREAVALEPPR